MNYRISFAGRLFAVLSALLPVKHLNLRLLPVGSGNRARQRLAVCRDFYPLCVDVFVLHPVGDLDRALVHRCAEAV